MSVLENGEYKSDTIANVSPRIAKIVNMLEDSRLLERLDVDLIPDTIEATQTFLNTVPPSPDVLVALFPSGQYVFYRLPQDAGCGVGVVQGLSMNHSHSCNWSVLIKPVHALLRVTDVGFMYDMTTYSVIAVDLQRVDTLGHLEEIQVIPLVNAP